MKILYIANVRLPTDRAHGAQIMNTCAALAAQGHAIELVVPRRFNSIKTDPFEFYGLQRNFKIRKLFSVDFLSLGILKPVAYIIQASTFALSVFFCALVKGVADKGVVYGRDEIVLSPISYISRKVFWETHVGSDNIFSRILLRRAAGIVCITKGLADFYISKGMAGSKLLVAPDAVDIRRFVGIADDKQALRKELGLPEEARIVTYCGSISAYSWKGVDVFLSSAAYITDQSARFLVVGGSQKDVEKLKMQYADPRILYVGNVAPIFVPKYLKASDVLVLPNKSGDPISEKFTSPMKLFEYMASGVPIVASRLPSISEILNDSNAVLVPPNEAGALAAGISQLMREPEQAKECAARALSDVQQYTWEARARGIVGFISTRI